MATMTGPAISRTADVGTAAFGELSATSAAKFDGLVTLAAAIGWVPFQASHVLVYVSGGVRRCPRFNTSSAFILRPWSRSARIVGSVSRMRACYGWFVGCGYRMRSQLDADFGAYVLEVLYVATPDHASRPVTFAFPGQWRPRREFRQLAQARPHLVRRELVSRYRLRRRAGRRALSSEAERS